MTTTIIHCDRCGEHIEQGRVKLVAAAGSPPSTWSVDPATGGGTIDLCKDCAACLSVWLGSWLAGKAGDTQESNR